MALTGLSKIGAFIATASAGTGLTENAEYTFHRNFVNFTSPVYTEKINETAVPNNGGFPMKTVTSRSYGDLELKLFKVGSSDASYDKFSRECDNFDDGAGNIEDCLIFMPSGVAGEYEVTCYTGRFYKFTDVDFAGDDIQQYSTSLSVYCDKKRAKATVVGDTITVKTGSNNID